MIEEYVKMVRISFDREYGDVLTDINTVFLVEKLEDFEKSIEHVLGSESYQQSKATRLLADLWSTNEEYINIDEDTDAEIIEEKDIELEDQFLMLHDPFNTKNSHLVEDEETVLIFAKRIVIQFANIKFGGRYCFCAKYRMEGMCYKTSCDWYAVPYYWINNPVITGAIPSENKSWQPDVYDQDWIETKAWVQINEGDREADILLSETFLRSSKVMDQLMIDIYEALR